MLINQFIVKFGEVDLEQSKISSIKERLAKVMGEYGIGVEFVFFDNDDI
jgi:hypothetical protein